jgi:hypothetical protein
VWALNSANSRDLIDRLRPHGRDRSFVVAEVGEGWRPLVVECHERLAAAFPDYELLAIKQKMGRTGLSGIPPQVGRWPNAVDSTGAC